MLKRLSKLNLDLLLKYGVAAIILAVPLYPKFPFLTVPGIYVSVRLEDFLILVVALIWFFKKLPELPRLWRDPIVRAIIIFLVVGFVSTACGIIFLKSVTWHIGFLTWGRRVEYLIGFFIALTTLRSKEDLMFYVKCVGLVLILVFVFGVGQKYLGWPVITTQNMEYSKGIALRYVPGGHLASTFAGHYDMATYIILMVPIFYALFFVTKDKFLKFLILLVIVTSFWLLVNAASRISAVSYVISVSTTLFLIRKYKYIPIVVIVTIIFVFSTSNLLDRYINIIDVIRKKISVVVVHEAWAQDVVSPTPTNPPVTISMPILEDRSTSIRFNVEWPRAIRALEKNLLLGTGYSSITLATDNDYLRVLGELGLLGAVAAFFVYFRIIKTFLKKIPLSKNIDFKSAYLAGIIGAIPGILLNAVFIDVFEASKFAIAFWLMIGFGIALIRHEKI